ncbi:MAG: hypothetical protein AAGD07_17890 [Planctomycetota bacterium]
MMEKRLLVLGGRDGPIGGRRLGWHLNELVLASKRHRCRLDFADYESIFAELGQPVGHGGNDVLVQSSEEPEGSWNTSRPTSWGAFDSVLTRTMPAGSLEQITFRLSCMHATHASRLQARARWINPPKALEWSIDKYMTLARAASLGIPVPETRVVQDRDAAMNAFEDLGGDVVVKPLFGGEGRGVLRLHDPELAWTTFSSLTAIGSICYVQRRIGQQQDATTARDFRILVLGERMWTLVRENETDFRTNRRHGSRMQLIAPEPSWCEMARRICQHFDLELAAIDFIPDSLPEGVRLLEVNAVPGWRGAQAVVPDCLADLIVEHCLSRNASSESSPAIAE